MCLWDVGDWLWKCDEMWLATSLQLVERRQNQELAHGVQKTPGVFDWAFFQMNIPKD